MRHATLIALFLAGEALAHPGHGAGGWPSATLSHLLGEPDHLALILLPVAIAAAWLLRPRKPPKALTPRAGSDRVPLARQ
ncbi:MAG: hypothetical protein EPO27_08635 [Betaproteobacteria bacterium]|nr:MAG: hypothetical protein EPO27_08635 [Betaproteobacteria bacterium]